MTDAALVLFVGLLLAAIVFGCGRGGPRPPGVSWFVVVHEMQPATKKAKGRMQRRRAKRS